MQFTYLSIHPGILKGFWSEGLLSKALTQGKLEMQSINIREFADPPHFRVDDKPYGGGPGMVLQCPPIVRALRSLPAVPRSISLLMSAKGKRFTQEFAQKLTEYDRIVFICGRYEGVDERISEFYCDEEISVGDYVLMGGEVAAAAITESVARLHPAVIGNPLSLADESHGQAGEKEYPQYTRPADFEGHPVPKILMEGDHAKVQQWRESQRKP